MAKLNNLPLHVSFFVYFCTVKKRKHILHYSLTKKNFTMKKTSVLLLMALFLGIAYSGKLHAQLIVTDASQLSGWNADSLVRNILLDNGVTISNARFNGSSEVIDCNSIGIFNTGATPTNLGMQSGLILASGGISVAVGPNNDEGLSVPTTCGSYYDNDLASIASDVPNDVAVLEFDFVPWDNILTFSFVFGSEEYMEYVGEGYNDVFGFFVEGANPAGGYYDRQNMALIPGTTEVVSIDNVNLNHNSAYYIDNTGGATIQFDGFTTLMEVSFDVVPMSNYHIKMAICDVGDDMYDSGVFLKAHSFSTNFTYGMTIDNWFYTDIPENHFFCTNNEIEFNTVTNWNYDDVVWYFGDGTSAQGEHVTHTYSADGFYTVTNVLHNPHRDMDSLYISKEIEVRTLLSEEYATACDSYDWHGTTYTESGTYFYIVQMPESCDSTIMLHLTINPVDTTYLNVTACDEYEWYNTTYTEPGVYEHLEQSVAGCDSLLVLNLDISGSFSSEEEVTACNNYVWRGTTYMESGTYTNFVQVPGACDSTFVLHLTLGHDAQSDTTAIACNTFTWHGATYTASGDYPYSTQTILGCDSIVTLHLTIGHEQVHPTEMETTCDDSFTWHGQNYLHSGIYYDTIAGVAGCDDIYVLDLTFVEGYSTTLNETVCDSFPWPSALGGFLTESGQYKYEGLTQGGCDSIVNLNLIVHYVPKPLIAYAEDDYYKNSDTIAVITNTEFFSFQYDFFVEDEQGHIGDWDSCVWHISKESWLIDTHLPQYQNETDRRYCRVYVAEHDNTPAELSCTIYNNHCEPYSITRKFYLKSSFFAIDEQDGAKCAFDIIPNPNNGSMELRFENMEGKVEVKVYDMMGTLLDNFATYNGKEPKAMQYNLGGRRGIYFLVANGKEGTVAKKVVIQ